VSWSLGHGGTFQDTQGLVQELRGKASSARQKAEEAKASQAASTSQNKVLESLTKLRNAGRITGFHVSKVHEAMKEHR
jgi:structural maintenance of chromosome 4